MVAVDELFRRSITVLLTIYLVAGVAVIVGLIFIIRALVRVYQEYRGKRLVVCPETEDYAAVEIDALHAAITSLSSAPALRAGNCSRWPERRHCEQTCTRQIDLTPLGCPVRDLLASWYAGKECVLCGRPFRKLLWSSRHALLSPEGNIVECEAVRPETLPDVLTTHKPVCRNCKGTWKLWSRRADAEMDTRQLQPR